MLSRCCRTPQLIFCVEGSLDIKSRLPQTSSLPEDTTGKNVAGVIEDFPDRARLEKKLLRKVDMRMSILIVIYILNYIDRNNLSAARTKGLEADLGLKGQEYPTLLSILYVGYILMQIPSNMFVQATGRPSYFLPTCIALWGTISILTGITHNFIGALLTRFFLGFVEAAFFPGAIFMLSKWYKKSELGVRTAILYCGSLISNALGPLMAAGILSGMEGKLGHKGWVWLFFIEGALTVFVAVIAFFILPDFPHNSRGFTEEERALAQLRMKEDSGRPDGEGGSSIEGLKLAFTDYKVWVMALSLTAMVVGLSFNQFFPSLTQTLGYNSTISLLLCAPPFFFTTICAFFVARHSDKLQERYLHIVIPLLLGVVGFVIAMATENTAARYVSMFLMAQSYSGFVVFYAWISASFPNPPMKRAIAIALINAFSQLGNISGAYIYPSAWGKSYLKSFGISIACFGACIFGLTFHRYTLHKLNQRIEANEAIAEEDRPAGQVIPHEIDVPRGFRYIL
ncbi:mfs general substrate transporter [Phaffia rhodozyma]|uniref:Mfs general substrate transporter n=1 Tax=Phaffia rhodozyma TaxID=264483 RepID=A0A0F7SEY9_PHARH|nr:mfs general substrate transporter [Phaffia rhodozyma]